MGVAGCLGNEDGVDQPEETNESKLEEEEEQAEENETDPEEEEEQTEEYEKRNQ